MHSRIKHLFEPCHLLTMSEGEPACQLTELNEILDYACALDNAVAILQMARRLAAASG